MNTATKDQATQRPWELEHTHTEMYGTKPIKKGWYIMHRNKPFEVDRDDFEMVISLNGFKYNGSHEKLEANARLIVKAVNCHDELVEALQLVLRCIEAGEDFYCNEPNRRMIKQALAKVR